MTADEAPERITGTSELRRNRVSDTSSGKVVVNRSMSLDGFIAGPGHTMDWGAGRPLADFVAPNDLQEIAAATGAMLIGRRTHEVGKKMKPDEPGGVDYPFSGPFFVLTHEPPNPPDPGVTFLTGDVGEAVATARDAAGGRNLEVLGADVAGQCLGRGLVDEILVYVMPVLLGDGIRFSAPRAREDSPGTDQQHTVARRDHPSVPRPQVEPAQRSESRPFRWTQTGTRLDTDLLRAYSEPYG